MGTPDDARPKGEKAKDERQLDKALENTFPASDPPSVTRAPKDKRITPQPSDPENKGSAPGTPKR